MIIDNLSLFEAAKVGLSNRLFVNGWNLGSRLRFISNHPDKYEKDIIHLYISNKKFIGIAHAEYVDNIDAYVCEFFVRKSYRRKGIATKLFNSLKNKIKDKQVYAYGSGIKNSDKFFDRIKLEEEPKHDNYYR